MIRTSTVSEGNLMVSRATACQLFVACRGDSILQTEQPSSTLMFHHPRQVQLRDLLENPPAEIVTRPAYFYFVHTWLGAYGARTAKGIRLFSNCSLVQQIVRHLSREQMSALSAQRRTYTQNQVRAACGLSSITGIPGELAATQEYPPAYCLEVLSHWEAHRGAWASRSLRHNEDLPMPENLGTRFRDSWPDLKLEELATELNFPYDRLAV